LKLTRFAAEGKESYGVQVDENQILDLHALSQLMKRPLSSSLDTLIQSGEKARRDLENLIKEAQDKNKAQALVPIRRARLLAPLANPPKIVCLGLNYRDHIAEQNAATPDDLVIFMKPRTAIIGPDDLIIKPPFVSKLDYEAELAVIIGKKGRNISKEEAKQHIFGYTCFNDVSARDIQFKDKQWTRGKSFDTFAPIGPCITTADQIGDPTNLRVRTRVNSATRQDSTTRNMVFDVYEIVHRLSQVMTLEPCDIIATGTPAGVGFAMKPEPQFLNVDDVVEIEIENIGLLRNRISRQAKAT
jgi:2-keto-4-pentenoate hydratase/2-oxohepta-3-ene-1,7-dioic acid hydratase in catechol pathway